MNKTFLVFIILFLFIKTLTGQTLFTPGKGFQSTFSLGDAQYKEYLINGLRNNGVDLSFGLNYSIEKNSLNHEFGLNIDASYLWNRYGWPNWYAQPNLHYRLLTALSEQFEVGGTFGYSSMYYQNENFDSHHLYWVTTLAIGISACYRLPINSSLTIMIPVNIPLAGFLSRPDADRRLVLNEPDLKMTDLLKQINSNFKFVTPGSNFFEIETGIFFSTRLNNKKLATIGYKLRYEQTATSMKTQLFSNQICIQYPLAKSQK